MKHKQAAKAHFRNRLLKRYGKVPTLKEIDTIRLSLKHRQCFLWQDCGETIQGIVPFRNIHISAVYNKAIDGVVTAGVPL